MSISKERGHAPSIDGNQPTGLPAQHTSYRASHEAGSYPGHIAVEANGYSMAPNSIERGKDEQKHSWHQIMLCQ